MYVCMSARVRVCFCVYVCASGIREASICGWSGGVSVSEIKNSCIYLQLGNDHGYLLCKLSFSYNSTTNCSSQSPEQKSFVFTASVPLETFDLMAVSALSLQRPVSQLL